MAVEKIEHELFVDVHAPQRVEVNPGQMVTVFAFGDKGLLVVEDITYINEIGQKKKEQRSHKIIPPEPSHQLAGEPEAHFSTNTFQNETMIIFSFSRTPPKATLYR